MKNEKIMKLLLDKGADINIRDDSDLSTSLMIAVSNEDIIMTQILLLRGADVNNQNILGYTALMIATLKGNAPLVNMLLDKGADINMRDKNGYTALFQATITGRDHITQILQARNISNNCHNDAKMNKALMKSTSRNNNSSTNTIATTANNCNIKTRHDSVTPTGCCAVQ